MVSPTAWDVGIRRILIAGLAVLTGLACGLATDAADAKKKKKRTRAAGIYVGTTNLVGFKTVRFRLTPQGGIVDFAVPDLQLSCSVENPDGSTTFSRKPDALTAPPMSTGVPVPGRRLPLGMRFRYEDPLPPPPPTFGPRPSPGSSPYRGVFVTAESTVLRPKPFAEPPFGPGFSGRANLATFSNTRGAFGTEECHASSTLWDPGEFQPGFEWKAVRQGRRKK